MLCRAENHAADLDERLGFLTAAVRAMGEQVAVRLGLSRPFRSAFRSLPRCYLMADGFFSLAEPQP